MIMSQASLNIYMHTLRRKVGHAHMHMRICAHQSSTDRCLEVHVHMQARCVGGHVLASDLRGCSSFLHHGIATAVFVNSVLDDFESPAARFFPATVALARAASTRRQTPAATTAATTAATPAATSAATTPFNRHSIARQLKTAVLSEPKTAVIGTQDSCY